MYQQQVTKQMQKIMVVYNIIFSYSRWRWCWYCNCYTGGGGAGGYRESKSVDDYICLGSMEQEFNSYSTTYSVTVGAGGSEEIFGANGSDSTFSTITSAGGGRGRYGNCANVSGSGGNGGGGGGGTITVQGSMEIHAVSPSQGSDGGGADNPGS